MHRFQNCFCFWSTTFRYGVTFYACHAHTCIKRNSITKSRRPKTKDLKQKWFLKIVFRVLEGLLTGVSFDFSFSPPPRFSVMGNHPSVGAPFYKEGLFLTCTHLPSCTSRCWVPPHQSIASHQSWTPQVSVGFQVKNNCTFSSILFEMLYRTRCWIRPYIHTGWFF